MSNLFFIKLDEELHSRISYEGVYRMESDATKGER